MLTAKLPIFKEEKKTNKVQILSQLGQLFFSWLISAAHFCLESIYFFYQLLDETERKTHFPPKSIDLEMETMRSFIKLCCFETNHSNGLTLFLDGNIFDRIREDLSFSKLINFSKFTFCFCPLHPIQTH